MAEERTVIARVTGRVQGVAFRAWAESEARRQGLTGWVRNEPDGSVKLLLHGPKKQVETMLNALYGGPGAAAVQNVLHQDAPDQTPPPDFRITG